MAIEFIGGITVDKGIVEVRVPFEVMLIAGIQGAHDMQIQHDDRSDEVVITSFANHKARAEIIEQNRVANSDEKE